MSDDKLVDKVEIYEDASGDHRWRAKSNNGRIIADSGEGYQSLKDAAAMATHLFPDAQQFVIPPTKIDH
jgi:uncharacterized protein YegP (UPF0339 family)